MPQVVRGPADERPLWKGVSVRSRDYFAARWSADRLSRRTWLLLALFGGVVAVVDLLTLSNTPLRVLLAVCFALYAIICTVQGVRTHRRP